MLFTNKKKIDAVDLFLFQFKIPISLRILRNYTARRTWDVTSRKEHNDGVAYCKQSKYYQ